MTILVTGATGLIGARLLPRLLSESLKCRALVRDGKSVAAGVIPVTAICSTSGHWSPRFTGSRRSSILRRNFELPIQSNYGR